MKKVLIIFSILPIIAVVAVFVFLFRSCTFIPKGKPVYTAAGEKTMYNKTQSNVYGWDSGLCILIKGADAKTFVALSPNSGKDKNRAYYQLKGDTNVDVPTFECAPGNYYLSFRDKNHVYSVLNVWSSDKNRVFQIIPDANPATYQDIGNGWSKDDKNVYYLNEKAEADPQTFVNINKPYSKDKNYLYSQEGFNIYSIKKEACNTGELTTIPESRYIRTNTKIYYSCDNSFTSLPLKDTASIEILAQNGWLKVDGRIVSYGVWLNDPQVDEKTFVSLDYQYFKDKNNVYYLTNKGILTVNADADLNTFEQTGGNYAKDKNHVYYRNGILPGVNPKDFRYDDKSSKGYSGKDVYFLGEKRNK